MVCDCAAQLQALRAVVWGGLALLGAWGIIVLAALFVVFAEQGQLRRMAQTEGDE
jgi:hypothetical protein